MKADNIYAYPYAKAIFALALEQDKLQEWTEVLAALAMLVQHEEVEEVSSAPQISLQQRLDVLVQLCEALQITLFPAAITLLQILMQKKRLHILPHIATIYREMHDEHAKILRVKVVAAEEITKKWRQELINNLASRYACKIELETVVAAELIGGAKIYIKDRVVDGTVINQLQQLRNFLNK